MTYRHGHADANQPAIVEVACKMGALVEILTGLGRGRPDLLIYFHGSFALVEVKNPKGLNRDEPSQQAFRAKGWPVHIVRSPEEMVELLKGLSPNPVPRPVKHLP